MCFSFQCLTSWNVHDFERFFKLGGGEKKHPKSMKNTGERKERRKRKGESGRSKNKVNLGMQKPGSVILAFSH